VVHPFLQLHGRLDSVRGGAAPRIATNRKSVLRLSANGVSGSQRCVPRVRRAAMSKRLAARHSHPRHVVASSRGLAPETDFGPVANRVVRY
jgi:hypothetical protein